MSYAVVRMAKMKATDLKGIQFHNQRERESRTNPDIDAKRTKDNYDVINAEPIDYNERVKEIIESQKTGTRKTRKDAVLVNEFIITSDSDFFKRLNEHDTKKFFEESVKFFQERYGAQNVAYGMVHVDEATPHMHLGVVPMRNGRLQGKNVFNRQELLNLQEEFPKYMQAKGFDVERGERGSTRGHLTTAQYKLEKTKEQQALLECHVNDLKNDSVTLSENNSKLQADINKLLEERLHLLELSKMLPPEGSLNIKKKWETKTVVTKKGAFGGIFGGDETEKKRTGRVILEEQEYERLEKTVRAAQQVKETFELFITADFFRDNMELRERVETLENENNGLKRKINDLQAKVNALVIEVEATYRGLQDFIKSVAKPESVKGLFKSAMDKITALSRQKRKNAGFSQPEGELEKKYKEEHEPKPVKKRSKSYDMER